jgi:FixJ family two-component response regulator
VPSEKFISIVEDDESLRCALVGLFRSMGHKARGFASAEEFLAIRDGLCACVISDIQLPGLNGFEMARRMRELGYGAPIIMMTARTDEGLAAQAETSGAFCLLQKPFDTSELVDCVERAIGA